VLGTLLRSCYCGTKIKNLKRLPAYLCAEFDMHIVSEVVYCLNVSLIGKRRCSDEGSCESEGGVAAAELTAAEQPRDYHCSPG